MKEWLKNTYKTFTGSIQEFKEKADSVLADYIKENPSHGKVSISEVIVHGHFLDGYPCGWHFSIEVKGRRQNPGLWATLQKRPEEQSSNED
ncbi:hypothetical protein [Siphonobacter sp. SORGH_AS_0500]|uniref:hypothetical protein n=1 Tax=Siphonobacter sp. SORGH_AS_0500 TaxID=1864824 RepID=UPI00286B8B54|nr:hypothetical protein [Siphonobacter sp. SORGH_AS_0500]